jgi:flagellar basal body rod protein FlgC
LAASASGPTTAWPGPVAIAWMIFLDAVSEITALITAQRAYEMNSKVISAADEMLRNAANVRG